MATVGWCGPSDRPLQSSKALKVPAATIWIELSQSFRKYCWEWKPYCSNYLYLCIWTWTLCYPAIGKHWSPNAAVLPMDTSLPSLWWALWSPNGAVLTMNTLLSSCWWTLCQPNSAVLTMDTLLPSHQWTLWSPNGSTWSAASPTFLSIL